MRQQIPCAISRLPASPTRQSSQPGEMALGTLGGLAAEQRAAAAATELLAEEERQAARAAVKAAKGQHQKERRRAAAVPETAAAPAAEQRVKEVSTEAEQTPAVPRALQLSRQRTLPALRLSRSSRCAHAAVNTGRAYPGQPAETAAAAAAVGSARRITEGGWGGVGTSSAVSAGLSGLSHEGRKQRQPAQFSNRSSLRAPWGRWCPPARWQRWLHQSNCV